MRSVLAVDGGNSKTDVVLVGEDGTVLGRARGGPFTPQTSGVAAAIDVIQQAVRDLAVTGIDHVAAYVAGADLPVEEDALRAELLSRGFAREAVVGNDTFALLRAGASADWGVAVVCGAGVNCVGVAPDGRTARFPALGKISGDWGGGGGLGEETLWYAIRAEDGRGPETALRGAVIAHFGTDTVEEVTLGLHFGEIDHLRLHELVPLLCATAAEGDAAAYGLVARMADEVAAFGVVALRRLDLLEAPAEVVLGGGVLTARHPVLMEGIEKRYADQAPNARLTVTEAPPIVGAALLGLDHLGAASHARLRAQFNP
jgi:N-acetylglucosamine kinase-like BadF-type ATPase